MSSEGPQALKQSKGDRLKKWFKLDRWKGSRKSSISPATPTSAPSTPKPVDAAESNPTVSPASSSSPAHTEAEVSSPSNEANTHPGPALSGLEVAKDYLSVTGSFLQLVLKKLPDAVDSNPVKVAFSLAKAVLELKEGMDDNANNVKKRIFATSELLLTVETALGSWEGSGSADEMAAMETFKREVGAELANLIRIRDQGRARRLALQEEDEQQIVDIFDRVDEARNRLMVATTHRIHRIVAEHQREFDLFLHQHLKASAKADHRFHWGQEDQRRTECIPGTRVDIREAIIQWATNTSPDSPSVYWLSGQGGAGKTTIAFTIARRFESTVTTASGSAVLGGSFFCSHTEPETRSSTAIVRTIAYRLASRSKAFKIALKECFNPDTVDHDPRTQLEGLLVEPWKKSALGRLAEDEPCYVIPIDALDELEGKGGTEFLEALFDVVNEHDLTGLKFFITSRSEPALVERIHAFTNKQVCRLEEVPVEETNADIGVYLRQKLGKCATDTDIQQLVEDSAGLFIYASTVVKYVDGFSPEKQSRSLQQLVTLRHSITHQLPLKATARLDKLYLQILETSLVGPGDREDPEEVAQCLSILHTFLCTFERTSASVVSDLLEAADGDDPRLMDAYAVLRRLHAVLAVKDGRVVWFHKSFPDFIFDKKRSLDFYCNQEQHHQLLARGCFGVMNNQLRFNIADISSSFKLDRDNPALSDSVESNISPALSYACQNWAGHLTRTPAQHPETLCVALSDFLQLRVLFWLEAMNLLQKRGRCDGMLRTIKKWVMQSKDLPQLAQEVASAAAFALYFTGSKAALSTPHLYISSLATFPRNYDLTRRWKQHFPGIPTFTPAPDPAADALLFSSNIKGKVRALAISPDGTYIASGSEHGFVQVWNLTTGEEFARLEGYSSECCQVTSVAFSPDSKRLASASPGEASVRIWDLLSDGKPMVLTGHTSGVLSVTWSPDGSFVASSSSDKTVRLWDVSSGEVLQVLHGHTDQVTSTVYSPDCSHVASRSLDSTIRIWSARTGKETKAFAFPNPHGVPMAYSPDGKYVAIGDDRGAVRLWDVSTGEMQVFKLEGFSSAVRSVTFSSTGEHLVSGDCDRAIRVWNLSTGRAIKVLNYHQAQVTSAAYLPDGMRYVSGGSDGSIHVWDLSNAERLDTVHTGQMVDALAYAPDGASILTSIAGTNTLYLRDAHTWDVLSVMKGHTAPVRSVAWMPDRFRVASGSSDHTIRMWDPSTGENLRVFKSRSPRDAYRVDTPVKAKFVLKGWPGETEAIDKPVVKGWPGETEAKNETVLRGWSTGTQTKANLDFKGWSDRTQANLDKVVVEAWADRTPVKGKAVLTGWPDGTRSKGKAVLKGWPPDGALDKETILKDHPDPVVAIVYSPDGTRIIAGSENGYIHVWKTLTGEKITRFKCHRSAVGALACSPDGTRIITNSYDDTLRVWDLSGGQQLMVLKGHTESVDTVAYAPNGLYAVSGSCDRSLRAWDLATGEQLWAVEGFQGHVTSVAYSPDGSCIISASRKDHSIRMWDTPTGKELGCLVGHTSEIASLAYSRDGEQIVSSSWDLSLRQWLAYSEHSRSPYVKETTAESGYTGWLCSPSDPTAYLMFVRPSEVLPEGYNTHVFPASRVSHVDMSKAKLGGEWAQCYVPTH